jgi:Holliday junction resolvase RusA-like endonuclease
LQSKRVILALDLITLLSCIPHYDPKETINYKTQMALPAHQTMEKVKVEIPIPNHTIFFMAEKETNPTTPFGSNLQLR